jgi:outer membrane protein assembly factor BamB
MEARRFLGDPSYASAVLIDPGRLPRDLHGATTDAAPRWVTPLSGAISSAPAIGSDGTLYITSQDGMLYAIDGMSDQVAWSRSMMGSADSPFPHTAIVGGDRTIYVAGFDATIYAFDGNGATVWTYAANGDELQLDNGLAIDNDGVL